VVRAESHWGSGKFAVRAARVAPRVPPVLLVGRSVSLVTPPLPAYPMAEPDGPPSPAWSDMLPTPPPGHRRFTNPVSGQLSGDPPLIAIPSSGAKSEPTGSTRSTDQWDGKQRACTGEWIGSVTMTKLYPSERLGNREKV
jgi:hypothetical protein